MIRTGSGPSMYGPDENLKVKINDGSNSLPFLKNENNNKMQNGVGIIRRWNSFRNGNIERERRFDDQY